MQNAGLTFAVRLCVSVLFMNWCVIGLIIAGLCGLLTVMMYNALITHRNRYKNAFAQIDVQLKRRYDLIPNLVNTAKGYLEHERETLEAVIQARNQALTLCRNASTHPGDPESVKALLEAETLLERRMGRFFALAEAYPDLKADQTMLQLMEELASTENRVAFARQAYNDAVMTYNTSRERVPNVIIANLFGFGKAVLFEIANQGERETPQVSF